jgi:hypothetical protein
MRKVIYIESFSRINRPSLAGRLGYLVADLFIVQWKPLLKFYKKAKYGGTIFNFNGLSFGQNSSENSFPISINKNKLNSGDE